jgi:hypothetical protein
MCSGIKPSIVVGSICKGSWGFASEWAAGTSGIVRFKGS